MRYATTLLFAGLLFSQERIDKIDIVVGQQVITELQLEEDLRVTAFLNETPIQQDGDHRRAAAERLIDQTLIGQDIQLAHYPAPEEAEIDKSVDRVRQSQSTVTLTERLQQYLLSPAELREHLTSQLAILSFTAFRFRPELGISEGDVEERYARESAEWKAEHPDRPVPSLAASRAPIRRTLIEQRTDAALSAWLAEQRKQVRILYMDPALQPPEADDEAP